MTVLLVMFAQPSHAERNKIFLSLPRLVFYYLPFGNMVAKGAGVVGVAVVLPLVSAIKAREQANRNNITVKKKYQNGSWYSKLYLKLTHDNDVFL